MGGKGVSLSPGLFGKDEAAKLLAFVRQRLPADRLEASLEIFDPRRQKGYKPLMVLGGLSALLLFTFLFDDPYPFRTHLNDAWRVEMRLPFLESPVSIFNAESLDNYWIVTNDIGHPYRIYNQNNSKLQTWDLPEVPEGDYPRFISSGDRENPIVWFEDRTLHWVADDWKSVSYKNGLDLSITRFAAGVVSGELGWFVFRQNDTLIFINVNAVTGEWSEIPLPENIVRQNLAPRDIERNTNGALSVLFVNETEALVLGYFNNTWQEDGYSVDVPENQYVRNYFVDSNENLWALIGNFTEAQAIQRISPTGEVKLTFVPELLEDDIGFDNYDNLFVDSRERIWLSGGYPDFISVLIPQWDQVANEVIKYTVDNSNYQGDGGFGPIQFSQGIMLTADKFVASINTNVETLSAPLPDFVAQLYSRPFLRFFAFVPFYVFSFLNFYMYRNKNYRKPKNQHIPRERNSPS